MADERVEPGSLDEISRLLALLVRLQLGNQSSTIVELGRLGISPRRIGELVGTTANTANVTLHKARRREARPTKPNVRRKDESSES